MRRLTLAALCTAMILAPAGAHAAGEVYSAPFAFAEEAPQTKTCAPRVGGTCAGTGFVDTDGTIAYTMSSATPEGGTLPGDAELIWGLAIGSFHHLPEAVSSVPVVPVLDVERIAVEIGSGVAGLVPAGVRAEAHVRVDLAAFVNGQTHQGSGEVRMPLDLKDQTFAPVIEVEPFFPHFVPGTYDVTIRVYLSVGGIGVGTVDVDASMHLRRFTVLPGMSA